MHHGQQLAASAWKPIRNRLGNGIPTRIQLPAEAFDPSDLKGIRYRASRHFRENRDVLSWATAARTLVVTGSRIAFEDDIRELVATAKNNFSELPDQGWMNVCVEIGARQLDFHLHSSPPTLAAAR